MRRLATWIPLALAAVVLLGALAYLLALALAGNDLIDPIAIEGPQSRLVVDRHEPIPWLVLAAVGGIGALVGWAFQALRAQRLAATQERQSEFARTAQVEAQRAGEELARARQELDETRARAGREAAARETERELNRELRERIYELRGAQGMLGDLSDLPALVLRVALEILDADRGLLLTRGDEGGAADLEVAAAEGFDADPASSGLARRFAAEVLERETIVREEGERLRFDRTSPADAEIENVTAIPVYVADEFSGAVICANGDSFDSHDDEVLVALGDQAGSVLHNARLHGDLREAYVGTVRMLAEALQAKDPHTGGHARDSAAYVDAVAKRLGLDDRARERLLFGTLLHDVGKIGISERILLKPGRLTDEEYTTIKLHPRIGYRLVQQVPALEPIALTILHHHERFDGGGYPAGLSGEEIPLEARIVAVADAFDAITSDRPYQPGRSAEEACEELERCAGGQFDPLIVRHFVDVVREGDVAAESPEADALAVALGDPELELRTREGEPIVGYGSVETTDHLTQLYSHRYFHEAVAAEAERAGLQQVGFTIVIAEVAGIQEINGRDGYLAGDRQIQAAARVIERLAGRLGGTACRYGGDRLGLLVPGRELSEEEITQQLAADAEQPRLRLGHAVWRAGDEGEAVIARARLGLAGAPA